MIAGVRLEPPQKWMGGRVSLSFVVVWFVVGCCRMLLAPTQVFVSHCFASKVAGGSFGCPLLTHGLSKALPKILNSLNDTCCCEVSSQLRGEDSDSDSDSNAEEARNTGSKERKITNAAKCDGVLIVLEV